MSAVRPNPRPEGRTIEMTLADLDLHPGVTWDTLKRRIGLHIGHPIYTHGVADTAIPSGLMIQDGDGAYWIYFRKNDPPLYRQHACFHELAHILLGHDGCTILNGVSSETINRLGVGGAMKVRARSLQVDVAASASDEAALRKAEELDAERGAYAFAELLLPAVRSGAFGIS
ncbi:hypothetical protein GCM10010988_40140 [Cnuibacter physcomitrellae]|nr:hypothetical protein [Cnuibacter physcomitrellae]GGI42658.1 hypothetical protein GCM10010988_40140 [Cnuibacter physcomitrellae]